MLIDEAAAKLKFCPLGRGVVPLNKDGKFAAGVNMSPHGHLTQCEGSACMLWETQHVINAPEPCPECGNRDDERAACKTCDGKGTFLKPHVIGFCGAGRDGTVTVTLMELRQALMQQTMVYAKAHGVDLNELFKKPEPPPVAAPGNAEGALS